MTAMAIGLVILGCAKAPHLRPGYEAPEEVALGYHEALRWQDYDEARAYVMPSAQAAFDRFVADNSKNLNIIDLDVQLLDLAEDGHVAHLKVKRSYFLTPSVTQREDDLIQTWKLMNGQWLLSGPPF
jgi:hypothetical protein